MIQHLNPSSQNVSKRKRDAPKTSNICLCMYIYIYIYIDTHICILYIKLYILLYIIIYYYILLYIIIYYYIIILYILYLIELYLISLVLNPMVFRVLPPIWALSLWCHPLILQGDGGASGQSHLSHLATVFFRLWDDDHRCPKFPLLGWWKKRAFFRNPFNNRFLWW